MKMKDTAAVLLIMGIYGLTNCLVKQHVYVSQLLTWPEAQEYCRLRYDDLSTVTTQEEINSLPVMLPPSCPSNTDYYEVCQAGKWTGLYIDSNNLTKWSGGELEPICAPVSEKDKHAAGMCGLVLNASHVCTPVPCAWNLSFYCMMKFDVILVEEKVTWKEALDYCRNNYIDLVSLTSEIWMKEAVNIGWAAQTAHVWTGLRFLNGHWFWTTQHPMRYRAWSSEGEHQCPARNLRCGALAQKEGIWQMRDCEEKLNFLCFRRSQHYSNSPHQP